MEVNSEGRETSGGGLIHLLSRISLVETEENHDEASQNIGVTYRESNTQSTE
jgi:hypothetical protein